jgi:hypothetical protein
MYRSNIINHHHEPKIRSREYICAKVVAPG